MLVDFLAWFCDLSVRSQQQIAKKWDNITLGSRDLFAMGQVCPESDHGKLLLLGKCCRALRQKPKAEINFCDSLGDRARSGSSQQTHPSVLVRMCLSPLLSFMTRGHCWRGMKDSCCKHKFSYASVSNAIKKWPDLNGFESCVGAAAPTAKWRMAQHARTQRECFVFYISHCKKLKCRRCWERISRASEMPPMQVDQIYFHSLRAWVSSLCVLLLFWCWNKIAIAPPIQHINIS
jgi:hypothetical protein